VGLLVIFHNHFAPARRQSSFCIVRPSTRVKHGWIKRSTTVGNEREQSGLNVKGAPVGDFPFMNSLSVESMQSCQYFPSPTTTAAFVRP
jgi:hypothetical protein